MEEDSQVGQGQVFTAGNVELRFEKHENHGEEREVSGQRNNTKRKKGEKSYSCSLSRSKIFLLSLVNLWLPTTEN